jgi:protein-S-isoprenylcysteine O-methyltransferase Ste14
MRKARFFWVYPIVIGLFATATTTEPSLRIGVAVVLLGAAFRLWADGYVGHVKVNRAERNTPKIGRLITGGPYAYVRHPLYVGTFLIGAGFCIAARSILMAVAGLAFFFLVYRRKATEEEQTILGEWGKEYVAYRRAVPKWMPTLRPYAGAYGEWRWEGIRASREWKTLLWVLIGLVGVYFWEEWVLEREVFEASEVVKQIALLVVAGLLVCGDAAIELMRRRRRAAMSRARVTR